MWVSYSYDANPESADTDSTDSRAASGDRADDNSQASAAAASDGDAAVATEGDDEAGGENTTEAGPSMLSRRHRPSMLTRRQQPSTTETATEAAGSGEEVMRCQFSLSEMSIFYASSLCLVSVETIYLRVLRRS